MQSEKTAFDLPKAAKALQKHRVTTRGTPRQRAPKGFWQGVRYEIATCSPPELIEDQLQRKLRRVSPANRGRMVAVLAELDGDERREVVLKLLAA